MNYRRLKNSGIKISQFSLGTYFSIADRLNYKQSEKIVDHALSLGINFIDTANSYADGKAEKFLGKILKRHHRSQYCIGTKVYFPIFDGPNGKGLSKKHIIESVQQSLKNLQTDYIDILQLHRYDKETPLEETLEALNFLKNKGDILYFGVSQWNDDQIFEAIKLGSRPILNQIPYNFFFSNFKDKIEKSRSEVSTVVYGALAQGVFAEDYLNKSKAKTSRLYHPQAKKEMYHDNEESCRKLEKVSEFCKENNLSLFDFAAAFCDITASPETTLLGIYKDNHFAAISKYLEKEDQIISCVKNFL